MGWDGKDIILKSSMDAGGKIQYSGTTYCIAAQQGLGDVILITPLVAGVVARMRAKDRLIVLVAGKVMAEYLQDRFPNTSFEFLFCSGNGLSRYWQMIQYAFYLRTQRVDYFFGCGFWHPTVAKMVWTKIVAAKYNVLPEFILGTFLFQNIEYVRKKENGMHKSEYATQFLSCLQWPNMPLAPGYPVLATSSSFQEKKLDIIFGEGKTYISLVPCSSGAQAYKQWPVKNYIELILRIIEKYADIRFLCFCQGKSEFDEVNSICKAVPRGVTYIIKDTSIQESRSLFSISKIVVGGDSGGMHLASTVEDTNCIILFGPADSKETGPHISAGNVKAISSKADCAPCIRFSKVKQDKCNHGYTCMGKITVDEVVSSVFDILREGPIVYE